MNTNSIKSGGWRHQYSKYLQQYLAHLRLMFIFVPLSSQLCALK